MCFNDIVNLFSKVFYIIWLSLRIWITFYPFLRKTWICFFCYISFCLSGIRQYLQTSFYSESHYLFHSTVLFSIHILNPVTLILIHPPVCGSCDYILPQKSVLINNYQRVKYNLVSFVGCFSNPLKESEKVASTKNSCWGF